MTKQPKASLISHTPMPIANMAYFRRIMHAPVPDSLDEFVKGQQKWLGMSIDTYFNDVLLKDGMPTFLESVNVMFKLENVSRALTHQLVRHRVGFAYSQQSMRCVRCETFAQDGAYYLPETVKMKEAYHLNMLEIQDTYNQALKRGCSTQDARGLLPTNIHTSIIVSATLRAIVEMINKRMCWKVQGEFRDLAVQMRNEITSKIDIRLVKYFGAPCEIRGKCMMESENRMQIKEGKTSGEQNTAMVCPIFMTRFVNETKTL